MILEQDTDNKLPNQLTNWLPSKEDLRFATMQFEKDLSKDCVVKEAQKGFAVFIK